MPQLVKQNHCKIKVTDFDIIIKKEPEPFVPPKKIVFSLNREEVGGLSCLLESDGNYTF